MRVNAAGGSYIRLVLLDVCTTSLSLVLPHLLRMLSSGFQCRQYISSHPCTVACDTLMRMQNAAVLCMLFNLSKWGCHAAAPWILTLNFTSYNCFCRLLA